MMRIFLKKHAVENDDKIIFILNQRDSYLQRAALKKGWFENPVSNSLFFDLKWDYTDN